ncbi:hypothetical protein PV327_007611 [Microctonus hyperodae]|uniref:Serpin domain-containing protein n=1 Tax=Microctonus hyperodae TaxID=165561 RepID=A0AA39KYM9_MICHY|nr:hypothetical protein PV327_007611 [Microctonus hyperodae]
MSLLPSRGARRGPIICFVGLVFLVALYELGIICNPKKDQLAPIMVTKESEIKFSHSTKVKTSYSGGSSTEKYFKPTIYHEFPFQSSYTAQTLENNLEIFSRGINRFSSEFFKSLAKNKNGNFISSPVSAAIATAMAAYGANGTTRDELVRALHLPITQNFILKEFQNFIFNLNNVKDIEFHLATKLFIENQFKINELFNEVTNVTFQSQIENINFNNTDEASEQINNWCKKYTNNKITNIITADDLNDAELSDPENKFSMYIIIPERINGLTTIIDKINEIDFRNLNGFEYSIQLCMPKFKIESELDLIPIFNNMGIHDMFEDTADFSNLTPGNNLKVTKIIQKAFINVDENGSEASAATALAISSRSMPMEINIDKPFISAIVSKTTGTPLFITRINDPRL